MEITLWFINPSANEFSVSAYFWISAGDEGGLPDRAPSDENDSVVQSLVGED